MKILVFEPNFSGHRFNYLYIILKIFKEENHQVTLLTLNSLKDSPHLEALANTKNLTIEYGKLSRFTKKIYVGQKLYHKEWINYMMVKKYLHNNRENELDFIFFPYIDNLSRVLSLNKKPFGNIRYFGISMVPSFHYRNVGIIAPGSRFNNLKEILFLRLLRNRSAAQIFTIDQAMHAYINGKHPSLARKITYLPDPAEFFGKCDKDTSREYFNIAKRTKIVLVYGSISERKGIVELLQAANHENFPKDVRIIVAGIQTNEIRKRIENLCTEKVMFLDRYLNTDEEYKIFKSADLVWCGYKDFYSMSGVLIQAAAMGLPVISSHEGIIAWITEKYEVGKIVDIKNERHIIENIVLLLNDASTYQKLSINGKKLAKMHTLKQFKDTMIKGIYAHCG